MAASVQRLIDRAMIGRAPLLARADTTAWRLFNGRADGLDGLVVEKWGDVLTAQIHEGRIELPMEQVRGACESLGERLSARAVYRKWFVRDRARLSPEQAAEHINPKPWLGRTVEPEIPILENGLTFLIRPYDGYSVGLFLEHRATRRRVRELSAGQRVLNTFAYTCGFSMAAAAGSAASTDSVDLHRRYLEWGKRNFEANRLDLAAHRFFESDALEFFQRAARQGRRYDLIVLDPPTFSRSRRPARTFVLQDQLDELVSGSVGLLGPGGHILLATNDRSVGLDRLEQAIQASTGNRSGTIIERPALPADFAGDPDYSKSVLARFG